jgi:hypothetical protein
MIYMIFRIEQHHVNHGFLPAEAKLSEIMS